MRHLPGLNGRGLLGSGADRVFGRRTCFFVVVVAVVAVGGGRRWRPRWRGPWVGCGGVGKKVFSLLFVLVVRVSDRFSHTNMPVVDRGGASVGALSYVMKCFTTQISKGRW